MPTDTALSITALVVSGISIIATTTIGIIQYRHGSRARLRARCNMAYGATPGVGVGPAMINIKVTNHGGVPATLTSWGVGLDGTKGPAAQLTFMDARDDMGQSTIAVTVAPGQTVSRMFQVERLYRAAAQHQMTLAPKIRGWAGLEGAGRVWTRKYPTPRNH